MNTHAEVEKLSVQELKEFLEIQLNGEVLGVSLDALQSHRVSGKAFLQLDDEELRELFPLIGERKAVGRLIKSYHSSKQVQVCEPATPSTGCSTWMHKFQLPEKFTRKTMEALDTGIICRSVRVEIVSSIAVQMLQYTTTPSPEEYTFVCTKLVRTFPTLRDTIGSGYGTWKQQLRDKFKNIRRAPTSAHKSSGKEQRQLNEQDTRPASRKRARQAMPEESEEGITEPEYDEMCDELQTECAKARPSTNVIRRLMRNTFQKRRQWIVTNSPTIAATLEAFPPLKTSKYLWRELVAVVGEDPAEKALVTWGDLKPKITQLALKEQESRDTLSTLMREQKQELESYGADLKDMLEDVHSLEILHYVLTVRVQGKVVYRIPGSAKLGDELQKLRHNWPYLVLVQHDRNARLLVVGERHVIAEGGSFWEAVKGLFGVYFTHNIEYPNQLRAFLFFFQHYVFNIKDEQTTPNSVKRIKSSLDKITV